MDSPPSKARTGRGLLQLGGFVVLCGFAVAWWIEWHQPWLHNRAHIAQATSDDVSVETLNVVPSSLVNIVGSTVPYFERVEVIRDNEPWPNERSLQHLHYLQWCDLKQAERTGVTFVDCPKLERIYLVGSSSLQILDCPALQEIHLVRCAFGVGEIDGRAEGVRVFVDGKKWP